MDTTLIRNKKHKGFSLLELLLVLGIIAALIVSAFIIYPKVMSHVRINNELKNISTVLHGVKTLYQGKSDFSGLTSNVIIDAKIAPDNMLQKNYTTLKNAWGGNFAIGVSGSTVYNGVVITTSGIPPEDCLRLTNELYRYYKDNLVKFSVNYINFNSSNVDSINIPEICRKNKTTIIVLSVNL